MDTQLLDAMRTIMKQEIKTMELKIEHRLDRQDKKLDTILEAWQIQKVHREELNDHEERIQTIEHRIPIIT